MKRGGRRDKTRDVPIPVNNIKSLEVAVSNVLKREQQTSRCCYAQQHKHAYVDEIPPYIGIQSAAAKLSLYKRKPRTAGSLES